jgi:2-keto-4-pentenoate hydratase/2-oxohepta-3-ene-1,7-dioic acid hydratase in catechol pathway
MKIIRYQKGKEAPAFGWLLEDTSQGMLVGALVGDPFGEFRRIEADTRITDVKLLAPVMPSKIVCVGRNYTEHAAELGNEVPTIPLIFLKPPSSLIAHGDSIVLPPQSRDVNHEGELAVVMGKGGRHIRTEEALSYIFGFTVANDITARDLQRADKTWARGKGFDTFCPIGPWIETDYDPTDVLITCHVNDELRQMASTRDMVFGIAQLIAYISSIMSFAPGDVLLTGTPAGVGPLEDGDLVSVQIEGLGTLTNPVEKE